MVRPVKKGKKIMFRIETVSRFVFSAAAALVFATVMVSAAVPMVPIA
jgi:hypothetical protein